MSLLHSDEGLTKSPSLRHGTAAANWLQPERFEDPNFSAEACIADFRRYVPLATIKAELQTCIGNVKNKLVEVLNEDYGEYVSLSSRLANVDGAVVRMRQPLVDTQAQLAQVQQSLRDELSALQQGLQRRQEVAAARSTLELLQEVAHVTSKVEKLLQEVSASSPSSSGSAHSSSSSKASRGGPMENGNSSSSASKEEAGGGLAAGGAVDMDARSRLLERVAAEMSRLMYLRNKGQDDLAFLQSLDKRINHCKLQLDRALQHLLLEALAAKQWGPAGHCLHGYVELGEAGRGEEALRSGLVRPIITALVKEVKAAAAARGGREELAPLVPLLVPRLTAEAQPLLELLLAPASGLALFDVLGNVLLQELVEALSTSLPGVFAPGVPAAFHANYQAGVQLLQQIEGLARTRKAVDQLRSSTAAGSWAKRWNLAVYFSLSYQDIAGSLEEAATASKLQPAARGACPPWRLLPSQVLWSSLNQCIDPQVFLPPLADRFLKLALQLLSRYRGWLAAIVAARQEAAAAAAAAGVGAAGGPTAGAVAGQPGAAAAAAPGVDGAGSGGGATQAGPAGWARGASQEELVAVACDAQLLQHEVVGGYLGGMLGTLQCLPQEVKQAVRQSVEGLAKGIGDQALQVLLLLGEEVVEKCVAVVKQLKGITATYRMTSKGPPVRHSHYVSGVLAPLRQLLDAPGAMQQLPKHLKQQLAAAVIEAVNARYQALAEELLVTVRKTESSLKRLKKVRPGEAEAPDAMSDSDKITLQLYLDVQEHGKQIESLGVQVQGLSSYSSLLGVVTLQPQQQ